MKGQVTLKTAQDYGRRCESIGKERRNTADLQDAMNHSEFKASHHALLDRLAAEYRQSNPIIERPPFMTVKLGTHENPMALRKTLEDKGCTISDWAGDIFNKITIASQPTEVDLLVATTQELTGKIQATTAEIFNSIRRIGELCPAEVGPQLRRQYLDQPNREFLLVAMEPITGSGGGLFVFRVERDGSDRWLSAYYGRPDGLWGADHQWVFVRRKQTLGILDS